MRTITFYSYKGGVGRSLLVANTAKYLSILGKKVFVLDLDLEAPGLQYKFDLQSEIRDQQPREGLIEILTDFLQRGSLPVNLIEYTTEVSGTVGTGSIRLMRSGKAPQGDYWRLLSKINWHEMFYGARPIGAPFFLELKEEIRKTFDPDFFLIDARTGLTEMGGIATTLLPDTVVCLTLASLEHLDGLRAVMNGIRNTTNNRGNAVKLVPILSRFPAKREEGEAVEETLAFLNTPIKAGGEGLDLDELVTLHAEPFLDEREQLLVGGKIGPNELPLLRDYLKLFSKLIPPEDVRPYVGSLIKQATSILLDNPDAAQAELETLTTYCADQEAYRALLKVYQLRNAPIEKIIATASLMWQMNDWPSKPDSFLVDIVKTTYSEPRAVEAQKKYVEFAEAVWRLSGMHDVRVGMTVANIYSLDRPERAISMLSEYVERADPPSSSLIVRLIDLLRATENLDHALSIVSRFKAAPHPSSFYAAWARLVRDKGDPDLSLELLDDPDFSTDAAASEDPATMYRLFKLSGIDATEALQQWLETAIQSESVSRLRELGRVYFEEGMFDLFEVSMRRLEKRMPKHVIDETIEIARGRLRTRRYAAPRGYIDSPP